MTVPPVPLTVAPPPFPRVRSRRREILYVSDRTIWTIAYWSCLGAFALLPLYTEHSLLIGPGTALTIFVGWHLLAVGSRLPWLPGLMAFLAGLQWIIAPWMSYALGRWTGFGGTMAVPAPEYFLFAVPSFFAYAGGLYLPFLVSRRTGGAYEFRAQTTFPGLTNICRMMVIGGAMTRIFVLPIAPSVLQLVFALVAGLSLVGALGLILLRAKYWPWWVGFAMLPVLHYNARDGQFLELLTWALFVGVFAAYRRRVGIWKNIVLGASALTLLLAVNAAKRDYRDDLYEGRLMLEERTATASKSILDYLTSPRELYSVEVVGYSVARLNEGWITSRLLAWTPSNEPFAKGETVWRAIEATILPRFLAPNKVQAGGRSTVPRFAGIVLSPQTSMNLSVAGEMYANWGLTGAWFGTFVVAFGLGWLFLAIAIRGKRSIFWFAWAPFLFMGAISPEMGLPEIFNTLAKSAIVMFGLIAFLPSWRRVLWPRRPSAPPVRAASVAVNA